LFDHGFNEKTKVLLKKTNCVPNIDGYYLVTPVSLDTFTVGNVDLTNPLFITQPGFKGILTSDHTFYLYNVKPFGGFLTNDINGVPFVIRDIIDADNFTFTGSYGFSMKAETGGGSGIRINSKIHGWRGTQSNTVSGSLFKPIRLSGENYCYMTIPTISSDSISNSGPVKNVFAKIFITSAPGVIIFNEFDSSPVEFDDKPIPVLSELRFTIRSPDNDFVTFHSLDYSFGFELTELQQIDDNNNENSIPT
jgi:hypothetical protein